jgi:hypothetical protein
MEVLAQLMPATRWLLQVTWLLHNYVLKKSEMAGDGHIPPKVLDAEVLQHLRDHPDQMTPVLEILVDELKYTMWRNNEVKGALKQYFNVDSIEVLCVDTKKERKTFAKATKSHPEPGVVAHTFVSALCDLFVVLISVLQYAESKHTKPKMLSLQRQDGIIEFVQEAPWILKMPLDHRTTRKALISKDRNHKGCVCWLQHCCCRD